MLRHKQGIIHRIFRPISTRTCYTFAVCLFSTTGVVAVIPAFVFLWATVDYQSKNDLLEDIILCTIMLVVAAVTHYVFFGLGRFFGKRWEMKRLRIINDSMMGETIDASISTDDLRQLTYMLEKLPDENGRLACFISATVVLIGVAQEIMVSGNLEKGIDILRGCLIGWALYIMFSFLITEIITNNARRDARKMFAERNVWGGTHYTTTLSRKFFFILILMLICTVITHGITSSTVIASAWTNIALFSSLTVSVGASICCLIFLIIMNTMEEIRETAINLSEEKTAQFISSSTDREFLNTSIGLYNAAQKIFEYKNDLKDLNKDLENKVLQRTAEINVLSVTDPLTGCYNRGYLMNQLPKEIEKATRYSHAFSIILCDIDYFKKINDTYGHQTGDIVLKEFVRRVNESIRKDIDWLSRYGGEEFLVALPETDLKEANLTAKRLRSAIINRPIHVNGHGINITASFGVTGFRPSVEGGSISPESLINQSDKYLYTAKKQGRNIVISGEMQ